MNKVLTKLGLGAVLAATAVTAAVPAEAQRYGGFHGGGFHGGGYHGGFGGYRGGYGGYRGGYGYRGGIGPGGAAVLGGIVGLGVGAAIADSHRGYYYGGPGYYGPRGYYGYPGYGYYDGPRCWTQFRRDYYGYRVPVRVCD